MSTLNADAPAIGARTTAARTPHLTFPNVLHSEWIKFWTLRSTIWTLASTIVVTAGIGFLAVFFTVQSIGNTNVDVSGPNGETGADLLSDPSIVLAGLGMAQLAIAVLGVLVITGEYSTGMIRSTLTAVPTRLPALAAKAIVLVVVSALTSVVAIAISWAVTYPVLNGEDAAIDLGDPETIRILAGGVLYLVGIALLAFAIGALLRHSAAAMATVLGLLLVVETIFMLIPATFFREISPFLPSTAGSKLMSTQESIDMARESATATVLGPWQGYGVLMIWVAVLLTVAAVLLRRRDA